MKEKIYLEINRYTGRTRVIGDIRNLKHLANIFKEDVLAVLKEICDKGFYTGKQYWIREKEEKEEIEKEPTFYISLVKKGKTEHIQTGPTRNGE